MRGADVVAFRRLMTAGTNIPVGELQKVDTIDTPPRFFAAMAELTEGYDIDPKIHLKSFKSRNNEMVVVTNVEYFSLCRHHLLPFFGHATIGYIPNGSIIGLSKLPRILKVFANRLQTQEDLAFQVAEFLYKNIKPIPKGVGVHLSGMHLCLMARGAKQAEASMHTTSLFGCFQTADVKQEFLSYGRANA